ncbi:uncharacterized protein LALA0_S02e07778g [Lachancea lanzarotensis]|uniref:LALA0S02e07778g1_1 n=1 Tax=Lachancea lanzarotensis TaxID=1245769 RepID=A0A0C7MZU5_9SACH|nr:uncharacterized protein LALA0_S02e07778g [Lachancea lanzarotensis]CEP61147.1 LALA0S02e07778g1_1 [Lachancea lanzarotensis]
MSGNGVSPVDAHLVVRYAPQDKSGSDRSPRRRSSVQGTSICVTEPWFQEEDEEEDGSEYGGGVNSESRGSRRLSASLRVCDLYQCIHQHSSATLHPQLHSGSSVTRPASQMFNTSTNSSRCSNPNERSRRFSDTESDLAGFGARFSSLGRSSSSNDPTAAATAAARSPQFEEMVWRIPSRSRQSSLSSSSQASSGIGPTSAASDGAGINDLHHHDDGEGASNTETREQNEDHQSHQDCWVDLSNPCCRHHHRRNSTAIKFRKALYEEE